MLVTTAMVAGSLVKVPSLSSASTTIHSPLPNLALLSKEEMIPPLIIVGSNLVFSKIGYSIAPANADSLAKKNADFVTKRNSGERAVAEACLHILKKFFNVEFRKS